MALGSPQSPAATAFVFDALVGVFVLPSSQLGQTLGGFALDLHLPRTPLLDAFLGGGLVEFDGVLAEQHLLQEAEGELHQRRRRRPAAWPASLRPGRSKSSPKPSLATKSRKRSRS